MGLRSAGSKEEFQTVTVRYPPSELRTVFCVWGNVQISPRAVVEQPRSLGNNGIEYLASEKSDLIER